MKVTVQTTKSTIDVDVAPADTVKKVMELIVAKYPVPSWANQALLFEQEPKAAYPAKMTLDACGLTDGSVVKFSYAKHLTKAEKIDMMTKGQIAMEDGPQPVNNTNIESMPIS